MLTMHSYNTRFQAKKAQTEFQAEFQAKKAQTEFQTKFQAPHITVMDSRRHRYATRFEVSRIRNAVIQRDCTVMSNLLAEAEAQQNIPARVNACINIFTYLRWNPTLFSVKIFADTMYKKMDELKIECLNHIQGQGVQLRCFHTLLVLMNAVLPLGAATSPLRGRCRDA